MIGSRLTEGLLDAGYRVIGIDRAGNEIHEHNHRHYVVDLADRAAISYVVAENQVDRIIHLAALAHKTGKTQPDQICDLDPMDDRTHCYVYSRKKPCDD